MNGARWLKPSCAPSLDRKLPHPRGSLISSGYYWMSLWSFVISTRGECSFPHSPTKPATFLDPILTSDPWTDPSAPLNLSHVTKCWKAFRELGLVTLAELCILKTPLFCKFKSNPIQGRGVHVYNNRARNVFIPTHNKLATMGRLLSLMGVFISSKLPEGIRYKNCKPKFNIKFRHFLVLNMFYPMDKFIDHNT
jgi:hypothetical protein